MLHGYTDWLRSKRMKPSVNVKLSSACLLDSLQWLDLVPATCSVLCSSESPSVASVHWLESKVTGISLSLYPRNKSHCGSVQIQTLVSTPPPPSTLHFTFIPLSHLVVRRIRGPIIPAGDKFVVKVRLRTLGNPLFSRQTGGNCGTQPL